MSLFDKYVAVDWSSSATPKAGKDSIWVGQVGRRKELLASANPRTRSSAMALVERICAEAIANGDRVLIGFDFAFGLPSGGAVAHSGAASWDAYWRHLHREIRDQDDNASNRFHVAARMNDKAAAGAPLFWGHPWQHRYDGLTPKKPKDNHLAVAELRLAEQRSRGAQPVWKLNGAGCVGSQALLGISRLQSLREHPLIGQHVAIWPFETGFAEDLTSQIVIAEIFPSLVNIVGRDGMIRDQAQVEAVARLFAAADQANELERLLDRPADMNGEALGRVLREEGWIVGVGHEDLVARLQV